jgi:FKBP-type peptidyl-prolyl cis-trans isomerase (trigger factor)
LVLAAAEANSFTEEYSRGRTEQKVKIKLGPYKDGAIKVFAKKFEVSNDEIEKALKAKLGKTYDFERINFTGSGAKIGHMVKISFAGKYADGPNEGQLIKGTKADFFQLELQPREDDPWKTFVEQIVKNGMGQEESKTFTLTFPADYKAAPLRNVRARFTVTVHEIGIKKMLDKDPRPDGVIRAEIEADLRATAERKTNDLIDTEVRKVLLQTSEADVEKVASSVSWAKFGEKSLQDFKWNLLLEEVARNEKIEFEEAKAFLRQNASVTFMA